MALSLFMMRRFIFVKNRTNNTYMLCSNTRLLGEVNKNFVSSLTRRVISWKLNVIFSPVLGVEPVETVCLNASSINLATNGYKAYLFQLLTLFQIQLMPAFRIFFRKLCASCFVISIGRLHVFMIYNAAGFLWTRN